MKIEIEIENCKQCPHLKVEKVFGEGLYNWSCKKMENAKIECYIEKYEESRILIPEWCPYKLQEKEIKEVLTVKKYKL